MAKQVQLRRGTTAQHAAFTGAAGEVTIDTDKNIPVVHNGVKAGGFPVVSQASFDNLNLARADKYLASQDIAATAYTSGNLTKIQYNNATDVDYEVFTYVNGALTNIAHYVGGVLRGNTPLVYVDGSLASAIFVGV